MFAEGTRLKDRYRLERLLGRGGMASVWRARDEVLERDVAVKVLSDTIASDEEFVVRFRREARIAAGLSHPNLIGVYDYAEGEERPYLVMEYVAGPNLAERLQRGESIDCERLARELLSALAHIHAAGILHRDVKAQNVLLGEDGRAKLIDFGIALPEDATSLTRTGNILGTARFISPEVMAGGFASERSDLYSCGVVLDDCLAGDPASARLRPLVDRLTASDPAKRPASAAAAAAEFHGGRSHVEEPTRRFEAPTRRLDETTRRFEESPQPVPAERPSPPPSPRSTGARHGPAWQVLGLVLIAALTVGVVLLLAGNGGDGGSEGQRQPSGTTSERVASPEGEVSGEETTAAPEPSGDDPALGAALNEEGFAQIQAGSYEEAIPVLEEAVRAFPPGTEDLNYAYALFNLGNALRLAGRPDEAIPVLERRLEIPNQTSVVREELETARDEAVD
jgi:predicted Ser/Thr protein kinase